MKSILASPLPAEAVEKFWTIDFGAAIVLVGWFPAISIRCFKSIELRDSFNGGLWGYGYGVMLHKSVTRLVTGTKFTLHSFITYPKLNRVLGTKIHVQISIMSPKLCVPKVVSIMSQGLQILCP